VFRTVLTWADSGTGRTAHNVIHLVPTASGKTPTQVYTCLNAHVTQAMWDWPGGTANVPTVTITPLDGVSAATVFATGSPAKWTGAGTGSTTPQVAGVVSFKSIVRGPKARGRIFLPFVGEGEISNGLMSDVAAVQAAWDTFLAAILADATTPMNLVVASYKNLATYAVTSLVANSRSRTVGKRWPRT